MVGESTFALTACELILYLGQYRDFIIVFII